MRAKKNWGLTQVHPESCAAAPRVHKAFLARLAIILPPGYKPILITDAGFRGPWFKLVNRMGWYWIGRIRNRDMVRPINGSWTGCKALYVKATAGAQSLGQFEYVRSNPVSCRVVLIKRACQGRHKKGHPGKVARSRHSLKNARSQREPWLLAVCPGLAHLSTKAVVAAYAQRMQIEETFRDLKSERFGLGFNASRSARKDRLSVLLLIACLASFVLRFMGEAGKARKLHLQFQSNTRRSRPVLSVISLAPQLIRQGQLPSHPESLTPRLRACAMITQPCSFEGRPQGQTPFFAIWYGRIRIRRCIDDGDRHMP